MWGLGLWNLKADLAHQAEGRHLVASPRPYQPLQKGNCTPHSLLALTARPGRPYREVPYFPQTVPPRPEMRRGSSRQPAGGTKSTGPGSSIGPESWARGHVTRQSWDFGPEPLPILCLSFFFFSVFSLLFFFSFLPFHSFFFSFNLIRAHDSPYSKICRIVGCRISGSELAGLLSPVCPFTRPRKLLAFTTFLGGGGGWHADQDVLRWGHPLVSEVKSSLCSCARRPLTWSKGTLTLFP